MTDKGKLKDRARDELFSHINRCGVLQASHSDQEDWLNETMEYLGERYPDLTAPDLRELYTVGLRFCRPAIPHGKDADEEDDVVEEEVSEVAEVADEGPVAAGVEGAAS